MKKRFLYLLTVSSLLSFGTVITKPTLEVASATTVKQETRSVKMLVYKDSKNHKGRAKSIARTFIGTKAKVILKNGRVSQLVIHVNGNGNSMGKGQNVDKIVKSLTVNGVKGKKANVSADRSNFDFVFSGKAFKNNGWAKMKVTIDFGAKMTEPAWIKFGKVSKVSNR